MGWSWGIAFEVLGAEWHGFHSSLGDDSLWFCLANHISAGEVCVMGEHLVLVSVPVEVGLDDDWHLEVSWDAVAVN